MLVEAILVLFFVVYFDQRLGAAHSKRWSKSYSFYMCGLQTVHDIEFDRSDGKTKDFHLAAQSTNHTNLPLHVLL